MKSHKSEVAVVTLLLFTPTRKLCRLSLESNTLVPNQQLKLNDLLLQGHCGKEDAVVMMMMMM